MSSDWEAIHAGKAHDAVSWWQELPDVWLDLLDGLGLRAGDPIVDVGSGSSLFIDALAGAGFCDLTAVDLSPTALQRMRGRLGDRVCTVVTDVCTWSPTRQYALWHDRAVFHFLTADEARADYRRVLREALAPGGHVVAAAFAPDGPASCSGLRVQRYDAEGLTDALGFDPGQIVRTDRRVHVTPWGSEQPFTVVVLAG